MNKLPAENKLSKYAFKLIAFAMPLSASALINMLSSFAAMFMIAQLGEKELAAAALAVSTFITITMVVPIFYAQGILISHYRGQGKSAADIGELVKNGFFLAIILAIITGVLLWNADSILSLFGQDPQLIKLTPSYFHYAAFSMLPILIGAVIYQFYTGIGYPRFILFTSLVSMPTIILLSYGFILGKFGLPKLALAGVTCSGLIVQSTVCICILIYMTFAKSLSKYRIFSGSFLPNWHLCKNILFLGFPIGLQFGGELAAMTAATYFMGHFGVAALAASQIVSQYTMLVIMISLGLSQALSILISEAYGKKDGMMIKQYLTSALIVLSGVFIIILMIFILTPEYLVKFFNNENNPNNVYITHLAIIFFAISGVTLFADGIRNLFSGGLRGLHDSKSPMKSGIFCLWIISLPLSYLIAFKLHGGPIGLRIGFMSGFIIAAWLLGTKIYHKINLIIDANKSNSQVQFDY